MKRALLAFALVGWLSGTAFASPVSYNATLNFAISTQPAPWSYGYSTGVPVGAGFMPFTLWSSGGGLDSWYVNTPTAVGQASYDLPGVFKNTTGGDLIYSTVTQPASLLNLHPVVSNTGVSGFAIVRFTAPESSLYSIDALFQGLDRVGPTTTDVNIYLLVNGLFASAINSYGSAGKVTYANTLFMNAGNTMDFVVGPSQNGFFYDSTGFDATITAVPEPASLTLLGLGLAGIARRAARRRRT